MRMRGIVNEIYPLNFCRRECLRRPDRQKGSRVIIHNVQGLLAWSTANIGVADL